MGQGKGAASAEGEVAWAKDLEYSNSTQHIQMSHHSSQGLLPNQCPHVHLKEITTHELGLYCKPGNPLDQILSDLRLHQL